MSIKFANARQLVGAPNAVIWNNQPRAALSFRFRYESDGSTTPGVLNTNYFLVRGLGSFYVFTAASGIPGTLSVRFNVHNATSAASHVHTLNVGTTYSVFMTYDQGVQTCWINGTPYPMGTLTGNTQSLSSPIAMGVSTVPGNPFIFTLDDVAAWNGYVPTPTEIVGLLEGNLVPSDIGAGAPWRGWWTLAGTPGDTVQIGDPGIANHYGDTTYDLKSFLGSGGTTVYSAPLVFTPAVVATPYVATSGKSIGFTFTAVSNGVPVLPTQALVAPLVSKNGANLGPLINPWITGHHMAALYDLPAGMSVTPGDTVSLSAPPGWANTGLGIVAALDGLTAIDNRTGRSSVGTEKLTKTLRPGWNNSHPPGYWSTYSVPKNWIRRSDSFTAGSYDSNGKPLTAQSGQTSVEGVFYKVTPSTTIDKTMVVPVGYWAVCWDDTDSTHTPTILSLVSASTHILSITEMTDGYNPGSSGVGVCRVFRVDQLSSIPIGTGNDSSAELRVKISNATGAFHFDNAVVYGPGDFTYTPSVPTTVDRSDPYAISNAYLDRIQAGAGSMRWVDSTFGSAGISQESEPEQVNKLADFCWGRWGGKVNRDAYFTTARPWNTAVTPYIYTTLYGTPYNATLGTSIDASTNTLNITNASTAPVIIGLRLKIDDELMRVLNVVGNTVTVERGSCSTTPASHSAGTIQVQNRWLASGTAIPKGQIFELIGANPHGLNTGQALKAAGTWPVFTFTDGLQSFGGKSISDFGGANLLLVTGQNTLLGILPGGESPWVTLNQTYSLPPNCKMGASWPDSPAMPVEFAARVTARFVGCNMHVNVPHAASDSLVYKIATWVRDSMPAGRRVYPEYTNEPWNTQFANHIMLDSFSRWLYPPSTNGWEFYVLRATQVWTIFRQVFGARAGEIFGLINIQKGDGAGAAARLEFAHSLGVPADVVAIAPYLVMEPKPITQVAFWKKDDDQAIDLFVHDLFYDTTQNPKFFSDVNAAIAAYNHAHGESVQLYGYEGGVSCAAPPFRTTLVDSLDSASTSFAVADSTPFIQGVPILIESEWCVSTGNPAGKIVSVSRGQFGTTAVAHAAGKNVRPAFLERSHDMIYNKLWGEAERAFLGMLQQAGFCQINQYALCMGAAEENTYYGAYHTPWQVAGYGDGSDGKADNRLTIACPGKSHSKSSTTNQDVVNVSVRGQAFIDWMKALVAPTLARNPGRFPFYRVRAPRHSGPAASVDATEYTLAGPISGIVGADSSPFSVTPNGTYGGDGAPKTITITPSGGGLSTPIVLSWSGTSENKVFVLHPTTTGLVTLAITNNGVLAGTTAWSYASSQSIDSAWLSANATAFGGDSAAGPWVIGAAFSGHPLPNPIAGYYPYILAQDISADSTAFVANGSVQIDLGGSTITYDDASDQPSAFNGEFESDADGDAPAGWDLSGCVEAVPAVFDPVANGAPNNQLFGNRVLKWGVGGSNKIPAAVSATMSVDGSNNIVLTFSGTAPVVGRQVYTLGYGVTNLTGQVAATKYVDSAMYCVVANPTSNSIRVSLTLGGSPLQAQSVTDSAGTVGVAQVIRTTSTITLPTANVWYGFRHAMAACEPTYGWAGTQSFPVGCVGRVIDADTGVDVAWQALTGQTSEGNPNLSGGYRPFCNTTFWKPGTPNTQVYLEIAVASSSTAIAAAIDALRVTRIGNYGILATQEFTTQVLATDQLPVNMRNGGSVGYNKARDLRVIDSVGGGGIVQGAGKSYASSCVNAFNSIYKMSVVGMRGNPIQLSVNGDQPVLLNFGGKSGAIAADRVVSDVDCTYGDGVNIANRQHAQSGINVYPLYGSASIVRANGTNIPQQFIAVNNSDPSCSVLIDDCNLAMNAIVSNCYGIMLVQCYNATVRDCNVSGTGYGLAMYAAPAPTMAENYVNILIDGCTIDCNAVAEREYAYRIEHRPFKPKTVAPGPFAGYRNVLVRDSIFTARNMNGMNNSVSGSGFDVRNGLAIGGNGAYRYINCQFSAITDTVPAYGGGAKTSAAFSFDQVDPGVFTIFMDCTFSAPNLGITQNGPDGYGCQGAAFIRPVFVYLDVNGIATDAYQVIKMGSGSLTSSDIWIIDPVFDSSITAGHRGTKWTGSGTFTPRLWTFKLTGGGSGYTGAPTFTSPNPPASDGRVVAMSGGSVSLMTMYANTGYGTPSPALLNQPDPPLTFSGGSPTVAATGVAACLGKTWPFRSYRYGSGLLLTVTRSGDGTPIAGATVTVTDNLGTQIFPVVPGSANIDGTSLVPTVTDASGHIGLAVDVPIIPLPSKIVQQGDSTSKQTSAAIAGTSDLDGSNPSLSSGSISATTITSYTIVVSKAGYATHTQTISPPVGQLSLAVALS